MMKKEVGSRDFERAQRADDSSQVRTLPVDLLLPKQRVAGSSPVSRSEFRNPLYL